MACSAVMGGSPSGVAAGQSAPSGGHRSGDRRLRRRWRRARVVQRTLRGGSSAMGGTPRLGQGAGERRFDSSVTGARSSAVFLVEAEDLANACHGLGLAELAVLRQE